MKNLKKILSVILCVILAASCFTLTSCDALTDILEGLGGTAQGGNNNGDLSSDDWFDGDVFDEEEDNNDFNDDITDTPNDDDDDDGEELPEMYGPGAVRFEAEYSLWKPAADQEAFRTEGASHASNGECVAYFRTGGQLVYSIYSDKAESGVAVTISAASAVEIVVGGQQAGLKAVTAEDLVGALTCNGVDAPVTGEFAGSSNEHGMQWHNFTTVTATVDLVEGWNEIVFTCTAKNGDSFSGLNVDYIELTTTEAKLGWWISW